MKRKGRFASHAFLSVVAVAGMAIAASPVHAQQARAGVTEADFVMKDVRFTDGSELPELRIHYATLGRPARDSKGKVRNAVMVLHGTTGNGTGFLGRGFGGVLFGPGQLLDTATHFIILPDGIGTGKSSKPSDGLRGKFPKYGYEDMVTAQYRLVTEGLGVDHMLLIMGTSMGCMHAWMWGERYPSRSLASRHQFTLMLTSASTVSPPLATPRKTALYVPGATSASARTVRNIC